ncbi:Uncharacterized protein TCM_024776 [Theobroma cacao]|uniref:RRM domain-containing protein n=1 Tax=Theobroma cacao TaxID=3641 RepID=A0A061EXF9_THECC|nr:Uncharacterized protein TCM_024776 [Theobroma cacao]
MVIVYSFCGKHSGRYFLGEYQRGFDLFRIVVDVFVPCRSQKDEYNFAFVRYRHEREMLLAVETGNGMMFSSWRLRANRADTDERNVPGNGRSSAMNLVGNLDRSFKNVVVGDTVIKDEPWSLKRHMLATKNVHEVEDRVEKKLMQNNNDKEGVVKLNPNAKNECEVGDWVEKKN